MDGLSLCSGSPVELSLHLLRVPFSSHSSLSCLAPRRHHYQPCRDLSSAPGCDLGCFVVEMGR